MNYEEALKQIESHQVPSTGGYDDAMALLEAHRTGGGELFGNAYQGIRNRLNRQFIGAQQLGSDLGRAVSGEVGKPYSPYRQDVESRRKVAEEVYKNEPPNTRFGDVLAPAAEFGLIPSPAFAGRNMLGRMGWNAITGAGMGAIEPVDPSNPYNRAQNVGSYATTGAVLPEIVGRAAQLPGGIRRMMAEGPAVRAYVDRILPDGMTLPPSIGGRWGNSAPPPGEMGPPPGPFHFAEGVQPTAGMLSNNEVIRQLETNQRLHPLSKMDFINRDRNNMAAIIRGVQERAITPEEERALMDTLNEHTGGLRQLAFETARQQPHGDLIQPVQQTLSNIRGRPGETGFGSPGALGLAGMVENRAIAGSAPRYGANPITGNQPVTSTFPENLYAARKGLDDLFIPGRNDELSNAAKTSRSVIQELKGGIDEALNRASGGQWSDYLNAYREGITPISEGVAFRNVQDLARRTGNVHGEADLPNITPAMLRRGATDTTLTELGSQEFDRLTPEGRRFINDAADAATAITGAQTGPRATAGSPTAEFGSALLNAMVNRALSGNALASGGMRLASGLLESRGSRLLNRALLNPQELERLLRSREAGTGELPSWLTQAAGRLSRTATPWTRRYWNDQ
jgi:hypothetical protein